MAGPRGNAPVRRDDVDGQASVSLTPRPDAAPHATAVEASRAAAEVQAAVVLAKQFPRSITAAIAARDELCARRRMAERAFYRYSRGGSQITGGSIHLLRALAGVWTNITYGMVEIERNRRDQTSTMLAFAWDLESNVRPTTTFQVPWIRSAGGALVPLVDPRDIYESNANAAARRVREMIRAVLPDWYVDEAEDLCRATLERDEQQRPLPQRRADMAAAFRDRFGVTAKQLAAKLGRDVDEMTPPDLAALGVVFRSLERQESTVEDEFPPPQRPGLRVEDLAGPIPAGMPRSPEHAVLARQRRAAGMQVDPGRNDEPLPEPGSEEFAMMDAPRTTATRSTGTLDPGMISQIEVAFDMWGVPSGPDGDARRLDVARRVISTDLFAVADLTQEDAERLLEFVETAGPDDAANVGLCVEDDESSGDDGDG
jgi:hypothetical protein